MVVYKTNQAIPGDQAHTSWKYNQAERIAVGWNRQPSRQTDIQADIQADIHADIHSDRQTDIQADIQTDIHSGRQKDIQTDIQADIQASRQTSRQTSRQIDRPTEQSPLLYAHNCQSSHSHGAAVVLTISNLLRSFMAYTLLVDL